MLEPNSGAARQTAAAWLILGLVALVAAGLFSILLVLARTPVVQQNIPFVDFFHVALVVHVDLSVIGLAWSGGYGVQRKTAGLSQGLDRFGEIAGMGLMGLGGLVGLRSSIGLSGIWGFAPRPLFDLRLACSRLGPTPEPNYYSAFCEEK